MSRQYACLGLVERLSVKKFTAQFSAVLLAIGFALIVPMSAQAAAPTVSLSGEPTISIRAGYVTKTNTNYSSAQTAYGGYFVCDSAVNQAVSTSVTYVDGSGDWFIPGTNDLSGSGGTIGTGTGCYAVDSLGGYQGDEIEGTQLGFASTTVAYDPDVHGRHFVFGTRVYVAGDAKYYWEISASALYTPTSTPKVLTIADCSLNSTSMPSGQSITGSVGDHFILRNQGGGGTCQVFYGSTVDTAEGLTAAISMDGAYYSLGSGFGNVYRITAAGSFTIKTNSGSGQSFTITVSLPAQVPTLTQMPAFSISGSTLTVSSEGTWGAGTFNAGSNNTSVFACASAKSEITSPTSLLGPFLNDCRRLYDVSSDANNQVKSFQDFTTAKVLVSGTTGSWTYETYDPNAHGSNISVMATVTTGTSPVVTYGVATSSQEYDADPQAPGASSAAPYTGPVVQAPGISTSLRPGQSLSLSGSNLSSVSRVEVDGKPCELIANEDGELRIVLPSTLAAGNYDLVIYSSSGKLTVQDGVRVSGSPLAGSTDSVRPSSKKDASSSTVKVRVFNVIGVGKVQIFVNGSEIAWINAEDAADPKLFDNYLVRTIELVDGKNAIEVFIDGVRVQRWAYWL